MKSRIRYFLMIFLLIAAGVTACSTPKGGPVNKKYGTGKPAKCMEPYLKSRNPRLGIH